MIPAILSAAALALSRPAFAAAPGRTAGSAAKPRPEIGALLLIPGAGRDWFETIAGLRKSLGSSYAVESAESCNLKSIQPALDRLQARKLKAIVAVPLLLSSHSAEMDQNRYIFGIRRYPSPAFLGPHAHAGYAVTKRALSKTPIVLAQALDDHQALADIIAARAASLSKDPAREALILTAGSIAADAANTQWAGTIQSLSEKVRRGTRFKSVEVHFLPEDSGQGGRAKAETALQNAVRGHAAGGGRVIVVPLTLARGPERRLRQLFEGLFVRFDGKPLLPDKKIGAWVAESIERGAKLPDMRSYTKEAAPPPASLSEKRSMPKAAGKPQAPEGSAP